jgi:hypothetical protein
VLPPQDGDALLLRGALTLTPPVALELDPTGHGIELQLSDDGVVVLDVSIPAGAFGPTKTGWKTNREGTTWTYVGPKTGAPGGIRKAVFHDQGVRNPGRVLLRFVGKAGSYGITTPHLAANVILPASGICFEALFPATPPARPGCTLVKASLVCK